MRVWRRREGKTLLTAQCLRISLRSRLVSTPITHPGSIDQNLIVGIDWHKHGLLDAFPVHLPVFDHQTHANILLCLQNVIPQQLLDQYLSMTDPARAQTVDTEIAKHCAFSLPGVALTLGRQNWHCLKDTYETLATDVQVGREMGNCEGNVGLILLFHSKMSDKSHSGRKTQYKMFLLKDKLFGLWRHFCYIVTTKN